MPSSMTSAVVREVMWIGTKSEKLKVKSEKFVVLTGVHREVPLFPFPSSLKTLPFYRRNPMCREILIGTAEMPVAEESVVGR